MVTAVSRSDTYVTTGKVASLKHELRNHAVKRRVFIAKALLASAQGTEILGGLGDNVIVEVEVDAASLVCVDNEQLRLDRRLKVPAVAASGGFPEAHL